MDRTQWLEERRKGIGGSDAAAALGMSKWKTPLQLYMEKRGEVPEWEDNEQMLWGRALEPVVRQQYVERTGRAVTVPSTILRNQKYPFMLANVDGIVGNERVLEIKTARTAAGFGEQGSDEVPQDYLFQCQHYMVVTELPVADLVVLIGGSDYRTYEIPADHEFQEMIVEGEYDFWKRLEKGIPPEPVSFADMQTRYGRMSRAHIVEASPAVVAAVDALRLIKNTLKSLETDEETQKAVIMAALGESDTLVSAGQVLATWKLAKAAERFDAKRFQAAHPELYARYLTTSEPSRRFLLKG